MRKDPIRGLGLLLLAGAVALSACSPPAAPPARTEADSGRGITLAQRSLPFLKVEKVENAGSTPGATLPGRIAFQPQAITALATPVQARVVSVHVRPGQIVTQGMPLITLRGLDAAGARASLAQARARAAAAEDLLRRQNEMVKNGVGLEVERFAAETAAREARAELARAQSGSTLIGTGQGDNVTLTAPANGVVLKVATAVGAVASPDGDSLVEIGDPKQLWVIADVPESNIGGIAIGRTATIRVTGQETKLPAVVDGIGQVVDGDQRRLPVYLRLKDPPDHLAAGMLAQIRFDVGDERSISVPASAVLIKEGVRRIVYVQQEEGRFEQRNVTIGLSRAGRVVIRDGLQPGEDIVVQGALLLDSSAEQQL